jgi:hypothetical protein
MKQAIIPVLHNGYIIPIASKDVKSLHFVTQTIHVYNIDEHNEPQNIY